MARLLKPIFLPSSLVTELKVWKKAFARAYGKKCVSYEFMIRGMLDCLPETEPGVVEEMGKMVEKNPGVLSTLKNYEL